MAANVTVIPPRAVRPDTLRVAAYCRVSSDSADQLHSYAAQIQYYTDLIQNHDGWDLVDVYADEGITGTRMDKREDFNRLLADCRKGKIDKVFVKSISRFARNTRDCLASLRELFRLGVSVLFEKENIDTGTLTTELMVSVSSSLAQQESVSISQNQRMSYQRRMERGEFITNTAPFGYKLVDGKRLEIVPEEAEQVRWMFASYLSGNSLYWIADEMTKRGFLTREGKPHWQHTAVLYILTNEKYIGDALVRKTVTSSFPYVKSRNHDDEDQYYIENSHPMIIAKDVFNKVQDLLHRKAGHRDVSHKAYPLSKKITCGNCGRSFVRKKGRNGRDVWMCWKHGSGTENCPIGRIPEAELYAVFVRMYNKLKRNTGVVLLPAIKQMEELRDVIQRGNPAMLAVNKAIAKASEQSYNISKLQTAGLLDTDACTAKFNEISAQLAKLRAERRRLLENEDIDDAIDALQQTVDLIRHGPERLEEFDEGLFHDLVEQIVVESQTCVRFRLQGGIELKELVKETGK